MPTRLADERSLFFLYKLGVGTGLSGKEDGKQFHDNKSVFDVQTKRAAATYLSTAAFSS